MGDLVGTEGKKDGKERASCMYTFNFLPRFRIHLFRSITWSIHRRRGRERKRETSRRGSTCHENTRKLRKALFDAAGGKIQSCWTCPWQCTSSNDITWLGWYHVVAERSFLRCYFFWHLYVKLTSFFFKISLFQR